MQVSKFFSDPNYLIHVINLDVHYSNFVLPYLVLIGEYNC